MINDRFKTYFRETFFSEKPEEFEEFIDALEKPIARTIRIKPEKVDQVKKHLESDGWILSPTNIANVFSVDRREDFDPLERRLGFSMDHLVGNFYIQELAAAHPVDILAEWKVQTDDFLILDMASSPGGKTTQLAEYFPNSFIIANEPTRERIPQLLQNTERMWSTNIGITLYPGQFWKKYGETFDRILLDAPCSGEGTLYKWTDAVKHWHIKNIKEIARLQTKLLDAALHTLKVGGEMIYSTCSLNLLENEWVLESMYEKYENSFEILFQKKFWPHIDGTWGFFVAKIRKLSSLPHIEWSKEIISQSNKELKVFRGNTAPWNIQESIRLYEHEGKILAVKNGDAIEWTEDNIYLMRFGEQIGHIDHGKFISNNRAWKYLDTQETELLPLTDGSSLDNYLRWSLIESPGKDGPVLIQYDWQTLWLEHRKSSIISNTFSPEWRRK